jgi:chemotaxis protein MotB
MARKREKERENHERWLVSYADFITLLFAFFVVMFASSQADKGKAQQVSESVKKALEGERMPAVLAAILGGTVGDKATVTLCTTARAALKRRPMRRSHSPSLCRRLGY